MPILIKDYEWEESERELYVIVPLKGVRSNKVHIISTPTYIKVSFPPYVFECFLFAQTDDDRNVAQISGGVVTFKLHKLEAKLWQKLQIDDIDNKDLLRQIRLSALESVKENIAKKDVEKSEQKRQNEKFAVNEMMKLETEERERIEKIKQAERDKATQELEFWKQEQLKLAEIEKNNRLAEIKSCKEQSQTGKNKAVKGKEKLIHDLDADPEARSPGNIEIQFTPRVFPTPVRESVTPQEEEWLKKQAEMRKICETFDNDLADHERNPVWLRDKGCDFFTRGDYHAAINAFSHGIRLQSTMPSLYLNRAACHMKLRNYIKCIEDCSKALEYLTPPVPLNLASRCKALVRRGTAFCQLELYVEGLQEYEAAIKLDPSNASLKEDADKIRAVIEGASES